MQFYDREQEVRKLREIELRSHEVAQFTVVTGRRRVGKSSLILKACENCTFAYLFVERKSEKDLCEGFAAELEVKLGMQFYGTRLGNWWDRRGENELDLVAENELDGRLLVAEVKRDKSRIDLGSVRTKFEIFRKAVKVGRKLKPEFKALSLDDM